MSTEDRFVLRRGPWTREEDALLVRYVSCHREGSWNSLAKCSGLKRTGKSCRLRWLNYLKPDIKCGNLTPREQLFILKLHSLWGNRWSRIAQHLPGRTDNEIKNYWRTRVQKQARQLKMDSNSRKFLEAPRHFWMPRLLEKAEQSSPSPPLSSSCSASATKPRDSTGPPQSERATLTPQSGEADGTSEHHPNSSIDSSYSMEVKARVQEFSRDQADPFDQSLESTAYKSSIPCDCYRVEASEFDDMGFHHFDTSAIWSHGISTSDCQMAEINWTSSDFTGTLWNME